jgi:hypothetical protein
MLDAGKAVDPPGAEIIPCTNNGFRIFFLEKLN